MRQTISKKNEQITQKELSHEAKSASTLSTHRGMGVGAACSFAIHYEHSVKYVAYTGTNINISGFQTKVHAEQFALQQAIMDLESIKDESNIVLEKMVVVTDNDAADLVCGHCLQVTRSVCEFFGCDANGVEYISANPTGEDEFDFYRFPLSQHLGKTYAES